MANQDNQYIIMKQTKSNENEAEVLRTRDAQICLISCSTELLNGIIIILIFALMTIQHEVFSSSLHLFQRLFNILFVLVHSIYIYIYI